MTSGVFKSVYLPHITVPEGRQRREIDDGDIVTLANSIANYGLINPLIVDKDLVLIAGERRLRACRLLGLELVPVQFIEDLPELSRIAIELEENIKRVNLTWQEECDAIALYHKTQQTQNPTWTLEDTAKALGISLSALYKKLQVQEAITRDPSIRKQEKFSSARTMVQRKNERQADALVKDIKITFGENPQQATSDLPADIPAEEIVCADFITWARDYRGPRFNFIHCDFPYGVNAPGHGQVADFRLGSYDDSDETFQALCAAFREYGPNFVDDSAHLIFWFSIDRYSEVRDYLSGAGWRVNPAPLIWHKTTGGVIPDSLRAPRRSYESAFMASRRPGDRKLVQSGANLVPHPVSNVIHPTQKPADMLGTFFRMFVDDTSWVLDPTCGSGEAIKAAKRFSPAKVLGLEVNPEFAERAKENVR